MMGARTILLASFLAAGPLAAAVDAQQYRARLDTRVQSVSFRGVALDSIPLAQTIVAPGGGRETGDGYAVECGIGEAYCFFFRPGPVRTARPAVTEASATVWGFGLPGLSVRADGRLALDLGDADVWPGTSPSLQLLEAYAEYAVARLTGRVGRQVYSSRLGYTGFDGARLTGRIFDNRLDLDGYLGWGLSRGSALPVTSEALNPLDDFQPRRRQIVAGAAVGWHHRFGSGRLDYQREVDPRSDYFVSERAAVAGSLRLPWGASADLGAEYDLALARWGSSDVTLRWSRRSVSVTAGALRYRPHFDLWTIWGAFSPVGYTGVRGSLTVTPLPDLSLRARGIRFWFEETETETPLASVEDRGWQVAIGATYAVRPDLVLSADHATEFGPGGSSASLSGSVSWLPRPTLSLSALGGRLNRPLEFRFDEATLYHAGLEADWRISAQWHATVSATRFFEERDRPDAAAFDWDQTRVAAGLTMFLGSEADRMPLPPAVRPPQGSGKP